jgi:hypothetical protein
MTTETSEKVQRYCPECGKKVAAPETVFEQPQVCPACKMRVYFLDYPKEASRAAIDAETEPRTRDPKTDRLLLIIICAGVVALLLFGLVALITKQLTLFFVVGCLAFAGGIVAISIFLDGRSKANAVTQALEEVQARLRYHEANQTRLVHGLHGFQQNFDKLIADECASLQEKHESILREAAADREEAAKHLEAAREHASAADAMSKRLLSEVRKSVSPAGLLQAESSVAFAAEQ